MMEFAAKTPSIPIPFHKLLKVVALVNMGAAVTNINILARGQSVFWRDISFGGNQFTESLTKSFKLRFDKA